MIHLYYAFGKYNSDVFIKKALQKFTNTNKDFSVFRPEKGRPYTDCGIYFSISHTANFTICAVGDKLIGVDAEKIRYVKNITALSKKFLKKEINDTEKFFHEWTAFESRVKYCGESIFSHIPEIPDARTETFKINDYIITICFDKNETRIEKERIHMSIFKKADIMLPKTGNLTKWSVVACDQYTSQPEYWKRVEAFTGNEPSTLNMVYPEAYLSEGDSRIEKINNTMAEYMENNLFDIYKDCFIYVERTLSEGRVRKGIVGAIDLECYDFHKGVKSAVRATEGTVLSRIPPRVKIRENALLELPHVMLLIDDKEKTVVEQVEKGEKLYDFELMENGGHLCGWLVDGENADAVIAAVEKFTETAADGLVFAVGDGNHSLATAKTCWDNLKESLSDEERCSHPARYCLVEIENIHDDVLEFEPIHRVVFGVDETAFVEKLIKNLDCSENEPGQQIVLVNGNEKTNLFIRNTSSPLAVGTLQKYLDECGCEVDYIHGADVVESLTKQQGALGFLLPKPDKSALFETVIKDGALPRKTFSMGEANEKRFYMEAKKIKL